MSSSTLEPQYKLPDLMRNWPWTRQLSPYYTDAKEESSTWVESFRPFGAAGQKSFNACDLNLLASLTYPRRNKEFVRAGCDLMNFYFVYDEYTDVADKSVAASLARIVIDAMRHPDMEPSREHILRDMTIQFWQRARELAVPGSSCFDHFIATSETYLNAVTQEADERAHKRIRTIDDYFTLRRDTCGARPTLALTEFGLDLSDEVISHPTLSSLTENAVDLIILVNDMHSYIRELSCGLANQNIITSIMHEHELDLQSAFNWLGEYTDRVVERFLSTCQLIPSWGEETDEKVRTYVDGLGQWVRGNDDWSCESKRYHGNDGLEVRDTRLVKLRPRTGNYLVEERLGVIKSVPREVVHSLLFGLSIWWSSIMVVTEKILSRLHVLGG
ncbi:terpenoid synthase [Crassisporium funariophilum]|nr:terpenoid synthase [Crassisporium funariophilum]